MAGLLNSSGTTITRLESSTLKSDLIIVEDEIIGLFDGLSDYKVGIIFAVVDIRLQVNLASLNLATVPVIRPEDSSARKVKQTITSELASERLGIELKVNEKSILRKRIVNYGKSNTIPLMSKISGTAKYLGRGDILSASLVDLGYGLTLGDDYIDIACDYLIELSGFKINNDLTVKFENE
ncbi:hypothetical protein [Okeania sp. SIO2B3]|uniref:hypothetical protein n=1 Tax=Okeania sp. SIO2B3 TaxID=2607784 RepID=UPI0013C25FC0|nr:hypothetical protein [Okeania sp. SIO2B3]NET40619.1 hypothetical protein [Okeania sp. SIO2B3]